MTSRDEALRALEKKWRDEAVVTRNSAGRAQRRGDEETADVNFAFAQNLESCADELAAILATASEQAKVADAVSIPRWLVEKIARDVGDLGMPKMEASLRNILASSPAHTSEARDALLKELKWRMGDVREMLMSRGIGDQRIYGCDEWSTPTVNLAKAIELIDAAIAAEAND